MKTCVKCNGSGKIVDWCNINCISCSGTGLINDWEYICHKCKGSGWFSEYLGKTETSIICDSCEGLGKIDWIKKLKQ